MLFFILLSAVWASFKCEYCHKRDESMSRCRKCALTTYCSPECYSSDKINHENLCFDIKTFSLNATIEPRKLVEIISKWDHKHSKEFIVAYGKPLAWLVLETGNDFLIKTAFDRLKKEDFSEMSGGKTLLHYAYESKSLLLVKALLRRGVDIDLVDAEENSVFLLAVLDGRDEYVRSMIHYLPDISLANVHGESVLKTLLTGSLEEFDLVFFPYFSKRSFKLTPYFKEIITPSFLKDQQKLKSIYIISKFMHGELQLLDYLFLVGVPENCRDLSAILLRDYIEQGYICKFGSVFDKYFGGQRQKMMMSKQLIRLPYQSFGAVDEDSFIPLSNYIHVLLTQPIVDIDFVPFFLASEPHFLGDRVDYDKFMAEFDEIGNEFIGDIKETSKRTK